MSHRLGCWGVGCEASPALLGLGSFDGWCAFLFALRWHTPGARSAWGKQSMPTTPLVYKKAEIEGASTLVREEGFLSSAMRRASPRPNLASEPDPSDPESGEVSGLLEREQSIQAKAVKVKAEAIDKAEAEEVEVHARLALLAHTALGFRYCLFPLSALVATGSISVVSHDIYFAPSLWQQLISLCFVFCAQSGKLAGQFTIWSLCLVYANFLVGAYTVGRGTVRKARPLARLAAATGVVLVLATATITFSRLPMCLPANTLSWPKDTVLCAGPLAAGLFVVWFGLSMAFALCCNKPPLVGLYVGWATGDMLMGVGVGQGLTFGARMLLKDVSAGGRIDPDWLWLWNVCVTINVLAWAAFLAQLAVFWFLCHERPAIALPALVNRDASSKDGTPAVKTVLCVRPERVDKLDEIVAGASGVFGKWGSGLWIVKVLYVGCLLIGAIGFIVGQFSPSGVEYTDIITAPDCLGCYCTARLPDDSVQITSDVAYSNETWARPGTPDKQMPLNLDVYRSTTIPDSAKLPVAVVIHGGGFNRGDKTEATVAREATVLAQHGFAAYSINYRLTAAKGLPDVGSVRNAIRDAQAAVAWILEQPNVDSTRVVMFGTSAGAIMAGSITQVPTQPGGKEFLNISAAVGVSGCLWQFLIADDLPPPPPWLDIHGTQDDRVFPFLAELTHDYLQSLGVPEEQNLLAWVRDGGHVDVRVEGRVDTWGDEVKAVMRPKYISFAVHHMRLTGASCPA